MKKIALLILMSLFTVLGHSRLSVNFDSSGNIPLGINLTTPACPPPSALTVISTTGTTATIQWTPGATETQWEIVIQDPGYGTPTGASTIIPAGSNPFTITGLDPVSDYEYYVRAVCSASEVSSWSGPGNVTTTCDIFQVPFMEGFNSSSITQQCWTVINGNGDADAWNMDYTTTPFEGNQSAMMYTELNAGNNNDWLISPTLNLNSTPRPKRLKFHYKVQSATDPNDFRVVLSTTGGTPANFTQTLLPLTSYNNTSYVERIINLVDGSNNPFTGNVNIAWHVPNGGVDGNRLFIDNVIVEDIPTCPNPTNLVANSMGLTSATLSWTPGYNETQWEVVALPTGSPAPIAGTVGTLVTSPPPFVLTNLLASTTYDFYVRAVCSASDVSVWTTPVTAATLVGYDQCAMPYDIPVNNTNQCIQVRNMSLVGSTVSSEGGTTCGTNNSGDVWFQFRAINAAQTIDLMNFTGTPQPMALTLYSGQCGNLNQIACSLNNSITATGLQVNTIYLVRVSLNAVTTNLNVQFNVCIKTPQPPVNGGTLNCLINTVNPDFEYPAFVNNYPIFPNDHTMLGWRTTATDHIIEMWDTPNFENVPAYSGNQFIELNANMVSGVYQDYATPLTTVFNYGFAHRGRWGVDVCGLYAGPPGGPYTLVMTSTQGNGSWRYNTGSYTVPAGQTVTRFIFQAISSSGGNPTVGNFLDNINFTADNSIISASPLTLDCTNNTTNVVSAGIGTWSAHSNNPSVTIIGNTTANNTTITGFSVPGIYKFDWTTLYCTSTIEITYTNNGNIVPLFDQIQPVCASAAIPALPTTSTNGITGVWSPAINNLATTTYTFTPNAGQCASTTTMTITVTPGATPTFTQVPAICSGGTLAALPTTSIEGITGTWLPALDNTTTTTYTFTPTTGQCASPVTMTITVTPNVTPTFTQIPPICAGGSLAALPSTSIEGITGSWSPTLDNTSTTTYTFTPNAGPCAVPTTMIITVTPNVTPTFTQVEPICSGESLAALPTTSNEDITGTWSPALDNTATTTYTFTPTTGQCSVGTTMTITVNPIVIPTFSAIAPICSGGSLSALPMTSNNGITGTWSPALNNMATTMYTFTPDAGQCAATATNIVTVNPLPTIGGTLSVCVGATTQLSGSGAPAIANVWQSSDITIATVNSTGLVTGVSAGTATITYINSNGCSATSVVTVNALPTISGTLTVCIGATSQLTGMGTPAVSNAWSSSDTSVATINASGLITGVSSGSATITYTNNNGCSSTAIVNVLTTPTATISISGASTICAGTSTVITITGFPNATVNYTVNGAPASVTLPASGTTTFATANLSVPTTYQLVNVSAGSGCSGVLSESVVVNIAPQPIASISGATSVCFNSSTTITFTGTPGATVVYTVNGGVNQTVILGAGGSAIVNTGNLTVDTTYALVTVTAGTTPNCVAPLTGSVTVTVVQTPTVTATPVSESLCSGQSTGIQLQGTVPNTTFSWTYTQTGGVTGASNGSGNVISQMLTAGTTTGTVTYTITPASSSNCAGTPITVTVTVTPVPVVNLNTTSQSLCTGGTTNITMSSTVGTTTFNWNVVQTGGVTGGTSGTGTSITDVLTASGTTIGQAIYTITPINNGCPGTPRTVTVTVYPTPVAMASPASETICSGQTTNIALTSTVPGTTFSWTVVQSGIFGASSGSGSVIAQTLSTVGLTSGTVTYTITPTVNGCIGAPITVTVTVNPTPEVFSSSAPQFICSGESPGIIVNPNISGTSISWTVVQSGVTGASNGSGSETTPGSGIPIDQVLTATGTTQGTVTYTIIPENNGCSGNPITVVIKVNPLPNVQIPDGSICVDALTGDLVFGYTMNTGLNPADYDFQWYFGTDFVNIIGTGSSYVAEEAGDYTVSVMNMTTGCSDVFTIHVTETNPAHTPSAVVTNYFEDDQAITVTVIGNGTYEYELDHSGVWQTSNVFPHVLPGEHSVAIRDANGSGCTQLEIEHIFTIGYPHFFTPNGDGYNDYWNIKSLVGLGQGQAEIMIFDRYGKLIKQIVPIGEGWDGTFNGQLLPSTDYWFTVKYLENGTEKIFKAHFSLKR